eukprot:TRINITY_DN1410_c0_g1_i5.p3 TRINITY_DN1410_c0_g1~~TRINITY_DN1410_c0_g1_i5.p3  ORF type:complete len:105 (-),score=8.69 TRINITY_DN1410_c0_g1_i5:1069-1383(-)
MLIFFLICFKPTKRSVTYPIMSARRILYVGNPIFHQAMKRCAKSFIPSAEAKSLVQDMIATMESYKGYIQLFLFAFSPYSPFPLPSIPCCSSKQFSHSFSSVHF